MKKIIILSDAGEPGYGLIPHLKKLFPECEIQILPSGSETNENDMISPKTDFSENKSVEKVT